MTTEGSQPDLNGIFGGPSGEMGRMKLALLTTAVGLLTITCAIAGVTYFLVSSGFHPSK